MKKLIAILLFSYSLFSQEKIDTYYNPAAEEEYNISVNVPNKKGIFTYLIESKSIDINSKQCVLMVESNQIEDFKNHILYLKDIYQKWTETAVKNDVKEISKEIDYRSKLYSVAFSYGGWHMDFSARLISSFKILLGKHYIILNCSKLTSATNQFIKSDGFMISFNKASDFDDFIKKLDNNESLKIFEKNKNIDSLFQK